MRIEIDDKALAHIKDHGGVVTIDAPRPGAG